MGTSLLRHGSRFTAWLLLAALTIGTIERHSDAPHRHSSSESEPSIVILEALHPDLPAHLEAASPGTLRACNACLLQRSHLNGLLQTPWTLISAAIDSAPLRRPADEPRSRPDPQRPSRAPPLA